MTVHEVGTVPAFGTFRESIRNEAVAPFAMSGRAVTPARVSDPFALDTLRTSRNVRASDAYANWIVQPRQVVPDPFVTPTVERNPVDVSALFFHETDTFGFAAAEAGGAVTVVAVTVDASSARSTAAGRNRRIRVGRRMGPLLGSGTTRRPLGPGLVFRQHLSAVRRDPSASAAELVGRCRLLSDPDQGDVLAVPTELEGDVARAGVDRPRRRHRGLLPR